MYNKRGNFYGILLSFLMIIILIGLFTSDSETTGFATKTTKCFEGTDFGECSPVKPKYCDNGALKPDCQKCGCIEGRICQEDGNCFANLFRRYFYLANALKTKPFIMPQGEVLLEN